jgi:hypothetical protein
VLVKFPSFSVWAEAGRKNTSVWMSCARVSPDSCSGESRQNVADSIGRESRTTSQSSLASARRISFELAEPTVGFWPTQSMPFTPPSSIFSIIA